LLTRPPARIWDAAFRAVPARWRPPQAGDKVHKLAALLGETERSVYLRLVSHWYRPEALVLGASEPRGALWNDTLRERFCEPVEYMQYLDTVTYLPDDILTKVDRASMAVSPEARVPLLDHRIVEFAWSLPLEMKIRRGRTKWILRRLLDRYVPRRLVERPKMGFGVPIDHWLRGPLREWAESLLAPRRLAEEGFFRPEPVREKWEQHLSGQRNWQYLLWNVLMFQAWQDRWL